jgi:hypothetical protein
LFTRSGASQSSSIGHRGQEVRAVIVPAALDLDEVARLLPTLSLRLLPTLSLRVLAGPSLRFTAVNSPSIPCIWLTRRPCYVLVNGH